MKTKIISLILVIFLLSICAVSAADSDNSTTDEPLLVSDDVSQADLPAVTSESDVSDNLSNLTEIDENSFLYMTKIKPYLYETAYPDLDYDFALNFYQIMKGSKVWQNMYGCSAFVKDNLFGRNFDWSYDHGAEFIVRTPETEDTYAVIGTCPNSNLWTAESVEDIIATKEFNLLFEVIPFQIVDGINSEGVSCCVNVVPQNDLESDVANAAIEGKEEICSLMLCRFVLDHFDSAKKAAEYIRDYVDVYNPFLCKLHMLITDSEGTYILEFYNNETHIIDVSENAIMTNFYISGVRFNEDGSVVTPEISNGTFNAMTVNNITAHGHGLERYNLINANLDDVSTEEDVRNILKQLKYTELYNLEKDPFWYSELTQEAFNTTLASNLSEFKSAIELYQFLYSISTRDASAIGFTTHAAIYNKDELTLNIVTQQDDVEYIFDLYESPKIVANDLVKYYKGSERYTVTLLDDDGNPIEDDTIAITINGVTYYRDTDEYGSASLAINLNPGFYEVKAVSESTGLETTNMVTVLPTIISEDLEMTYKDGSKFYCKIVDTEGEAVSGASVTFNINGVFYNKVTDSKGFACLNINLLPGVYIITTQWGEALTSNTIEIEP